MASNTGEKKTMADGLADAGRKLAEGSQKIGQMAPPESEPAPKAPAPQAKARADSTACPKCSHPKCPAMHGSKRSETTLTQYRECGGCGHRFKTTQLLEEGKPVGAEYVSG